MRSRGRLLMSTVMTALLLSSCVINPAKLKSTPNPEFKPTLVPEEETTEGESEVLRITAEGEHFLLGGREIWINGVNTPWDRWNDFGGSFNPDWWDVHFAELSRAGVNASRVWINCDGSGALIIDAEGTVSGVTEKHWEDLDRFFEIAAKNDIYIMATLLSFDHFKQGNKSFESWRAMLKDNEKIDSFVKNYTIPFVERYRDNPYLWSIDLCNEPDWIHEESGVEWEYISSFFARNAAAIHKNSEILVTVGMAFTKYNSDAKWCEGNKVSDSYLQGLYDDEDAYLDFWSTHYYDWVGEWFYTPFYRTPSEWGLEGGRPALVGETAAVGSNNYPESYHDTKWPNKPVPEEKTLTDNYSSAYNNGWSGIMPWTSNGVDDCGSFEDLKPAAGFMRDNYYELIFPLR